jgi:hypothetical protein
LGEAHSGAGPERPLKGGPMKIPFLDESVVNGGGAMGRFGPEGDMWSGSAAATWRELVEPSVSPSGCWRWF